MPSKGAASYDPGGEGIVVPTQEGSVTLHMQGSTLGGEQSFGTDDFCLSKLMVTQKG